MADIKVNNYGLFNNVSKIREFHFIPRFVKIKDTVT